MSEWSRNTTWRQGMLLSKESMGVLFPAAVADGFEVAVVVSHDCDLAQGAAEEPFVEVILARCLDIADGDGNYSYAKNPRVLHVPMKQEAPPFVLELLAGNKLKVPKEGDDGLAHHEPDRFRLSAAQVNTLQHWLAARYRRAAFPDEFDRRLNSETKLRDDLARILKPLGNEIVSIFFDVNEGKEVTHSGADEPYALGIYLLYRTDTDPGASEAAAVAAAKKIVAKFEEKCRDDSGHWRWIELAYCDPIADSALTYAQSNSFKKWHADHMSLRAQPQQPTLRS